MEYKEAGVDINASNRLIDLIKPLVKSTAVPGVVSELGGFGGLFYPPWKEFKDPLLVACADGVGTKLKVAFMADLHDTIGIDLVAMSVNDLVTVGGHPLFFLDYLATGKLEEQKALKVVKGIVRGCRLAGCALLGGETAEMPDFYPVGEYDLAGFAVGIVDKSELIDGSKMKDGDTVIGLASSGLHSNGFSLARKVIFEKERLDVDSLLPWGKTVAQELLEPTVIYVTHLKMLKLQGIEIRGIAHITGGGLIENPPRILPAHLDMVLNPRQWDIPPIFPFLQEKGDISAPEMYRTFNMGIGLLVVVPRHQATQALECLHREDCPAWTIGVIKKGSKEVKICGVTH
jgi:phosphoribosylformylglycinamidine cyclo-ligase